MNDFLRERLREPSTWRGLFALLTAIGVAVKPELQEGIITIGLLFMGAGGLVPDAAGMRKLPPEGKADPDQRDDYERFSGGY